MLAIKRTKNVAVYKCKDWPVNLNQLAVKNVNRKTILATKVKVPGSLDKTFLRLILWLGSYIGFELL